MFFTRRSQKRKREKDDDWFMPLAKVNAGLARGSARRLEWELR